MPGIIIRVSILIEENDHLINMKRKS